MSKTNYDIVVIGGGPGGYVAAIRAAQLGMSVAVIERESLGGICLNWGCIPTKALLRSAEVFALVGNAAEYGVETPVVPSANLAVMVQRSRAVSAKLTKGIGFLLKKNKVDHIAGSATLLGEGAVSVSRSSDEEDLTIKARDIIIATGARAREVAHLKGDGDRVWTYKDALVAAEIPKSLLVIGSGAIGIEFASFFNTIGSEVTVVEVLDRILPAEDSEIGDMAASALAKQGMTIRTSAKVTGLESLDDGVEVEIADKNANTLREKYDRVLIAIGISGNVENIGLEAAGVATEGGHITTDEFGRTSAAGIWAIGDVAGAPWLAHKASHEGAIAVEKIAGRDVAPLRIDNVPGCTYSNPQIASVGLTEQKAIAAGYKVRVGRFPFQANGKALAMGEPFGMIKTVFDDSTGELLGAHMIGAEVTELIQGFAVARTLEATEEAFIHTAFPHPTLSEMMHESALDAYDSAIHC